jgi:hypothetical protein
MRAPLPPTVTMAINTFNSRVASFREDPLAIDRAIAELWAEPHPAYVRPLLVALDDANDHPGVMFSLIHAAESFSHTDYVGGLLEAIPVLASQAPEWAELVLTRVLNSSDCGEHLIREVSSASKEVKGSIIAASSNADGSKPGFDERKSRLLLAAS